MTLTLLPAGQTLEMMGIAGPAPQGFAPGSQTVLAPLAGG